VVAAAAGLFLVCRPQTLPRLLHRHLPDQGLQCTGTGAMDRNVLRRNNILADRPARLS